MDKSFTHLAASLHLHPRWGGPNGLGTQHSTIQRTAIFNYFPHTRRCPRYGSPSGLAALQFTESDRPSAISETVPSKRTLLFGRRDSHIWDIFCHTEPIM